LQQERTSDGRQRQGKQPMTTEEQMREEEERRRGEPKVRGRGAKGGDRGRKRAQTAPTRSSRSRSTAARTRATSVEEPMPEDHRAPTNAAAEEQGASLAPWRLWTAAHGGKLETPVAQTNLTTVIDESRKEWVNKQINCRHRDSFERKAWIQEDRSNIIWVWTCPKDHCGLNAWRFPVVVQTYFGVKRNA
jgi:hypothetical protein